MEWVPWYLVDCGGGLTRESFFFKICCLLVLVACWVCWWAWNIHFCPGDNAIFYRRNDSHTICEWTERPSLQVSIAKCTCEWYLISAFLVWRDWNGGGDDICPIWPTLHRADELMREATLLRTPVNMPYRTPNQKATFYKLEGHRYHSSRKIFTKNIILTFSQTGVAP